MRDLASIFKALSDETRLRMMGLLFRRGELCVCDFVEALGISQSKASRHLRYLAHAGLVADRRDAVWVFYRLPDRLSPDVTAVLQFLQVLLETRDLSEEERRLDAWREGHLPHRTCQGQAPGMSGRGG